MASIIKRYNGQDFFLRQSSLKELEDTKSKSDKSMFLETEIKGVKQYSQQDSSSSSKDESIKSLGLKLQSYNTMDDLKSWDNSIKTIQNTVESINQHTWAFGKTNDTGSKIYACVLLAHKYGGPNASKTLKSVSEFVTKNFGIKINQNSNSENHFRLMIDNLNGINTAKAIKSNWGTQQHNFPGLISAFFPKINESNTPVLLHHPIAHYQARTNYHKTSGGAIRALKDEIQAQLSVPSSLLSKHLGALNEHARQEIAASLLIGDGEIIKSTFEKYKIIQLLSTLPKFQKAQKLNANDFKRLAEHEGSEDKYLNTTSRKILLAIFNKDRAGATIGTYAKITKIRQTFQSITDTALHPNTKRDILNELYPGSQALKFATNLIGKWRKFGQSDVSMGISDLTFSKQLPVLSARTEPPIKIKDQTFKLLLSNPKIDRSEILICSYGFLQTNAQSPEFLNKLAQQYCNLDYDEAIRNVEIFLQSNDCTLGETQKNMLQGAMHLAKQRGADPNSPQHARRHFETLAAQFHLGIDPQPERVGNIIQAQLGFHPNNGSEVEQSILTWTDSENLNLIARLNERKHKKASNLYPLKDREFKEGFLSKRDLSRKPEPSEFIVSGNGGLKKQAAPYFLDEIDENSTPELNRGPDLYTHSHNNNMYPMKNLESPFTASLSGHMFYVAAYLEKYLSSNTKSPTLQQDVNCFFKGIIATYAKNGFHSRQEVIDALREPSIQEMLAKYGVTLDFNYSNLVLRNALDDTLQYTTAYLAKNNVLSELTSKFAQINEE